MAKPEWFGPHFKRKLACLEIAVLSGIEWDSDNRSQMLSVEREAKGASVRETRVGPFPAEALSEPERCEDQQD